MSPTLHLTPFIFQHLKVTQNGFLYQAGTGENNPSIPDSYAFSPAGAESALFVFFAEIAREGATVETKSIVSQHRAMFYQS